MHMSNKALFCQTAISYPKIRAKPSWKSCLHEGRNTPSKKEIKFSNDQLRKNIISIMHHTISKMLCNKIRIRGYDTTTTTEQVLINIKQYLHPHLLFMFLQLTTFFCLIHCIARIKRLKNTHLLQPFQQWGPPAARVCAQWRKAWACQGQLVGHHALTDWSGDWGAPRSGGRTPEMGQEWKTGHGSDKNTWLEMFHFSPWALALSVCKGRVSTWGWHPFSD